MFDRSIIEDALPAISVAPVAHYTSISTLRHFIPDGSKGWVSARATPVQFLNDRMELSLGLTVLGEVADRSPQMSRRVQTVIDDLRTGVGAV